MIPSSYKKIHGESPPRSPENTPNQVSARQRLLKKVQDIDKSFVVSKLFYFFFYTALGALFPFFSLYYKQLWLTPSQIGILLALRPTVKLICLPLWKVITDKYSKPKAVYIISIFGWLIGYYGQTIVYTTSVACYGHKPIPSMNSTNLSTSLNGSLFIKREFKLEDTKLKFDIKSYQHENKIPRSIHKGIMLNVKGNVAQNRDRKIQEPRAVVDLLRPSRLNGQATPKNKLDLGSGILKSNIRESTDYDNPREKELNSLEKKQKVKDFRVKSDGVTNDGSFADTPLSYKLSSLTNSEIHSTGLDNNDKRQELGPDKSNNMEGEDVRSKSMKGKLRYDSPPANPIQSDTSQNCLGVFQHGRISKSPKPSEDFRVKYNYWILRTLIVIIILTEIITSPTPMIADSAVVQSLAGSNSDYGKQRLFGFFGLSLAAILVAVWVSYTSYCHYTDTINYLPCFYIFIIAIGATVLVSFFFDFKTPENNDNETELLETLKIFMSLRYGFFLFTILFTGFAHSLQIGFLFWFLQDIGGTPTLFAIIILVHSLSEVVMYFLSGYLNQGVGHQGTICIALAGYTVRFLMYAYLAEPWLILPMELIQGVTYGGIWSACAGYIQAPEEATKMVQSILHGVYWGVGMAAGALVSGFVIEEYGVQKEFQIMSLLMFVTCLVHLFVLLYDRSKEMEETLKLKRDTGIDKLQPEKKEAENFIGAAAAPLVPCLLYGR